MRFKPSNGNRVGKIKAAYILMSFDPQQRIGVLLRDLSWQSLGLAAKNERVAGLVVSRQIVLGRKPREQPESLGWNLLAQIIPVFHSLPRQVLPVIETSPTERLFGYFKT